jgi:hypothetical protein
VFKKHFLDEVNGTLAECVIFLFQRYPFNVFRSILLKRLHVNKGMFIFVTAFLKLLSAMTSKIFYCSRQRAMHLAQEVLREMNLRNGKVDNSTNTIMAHRNWRFLSPARDVEITMYADDHRVEVAVNVESQVKALDFGASEYMEEEILIRMRDRLN